jgi:hypothetical protein
MEGIENETIERALEAQRGRQAEIQAQLDIIEKQLRTLLVNRALMEVEKYSYVTEQERAVSARIKRLHGHLFNLRAELEGCSLAAEGLEAKLEEREGLNGK